MEAAPDVTRLLADWRTGDASALERLTPLVYSELRRLASGYLRRERPGQSGFPMRSKVRAGGRELNHNQNGVAVRTRVQAGGNSPNHNQTPGGRA